MKKDIRKWTPEEVEFLGLQSDRKIAVRLSRTVSSVMQARIRRGILRRLSAEQVAALGTATDAELAAKWMRSPESIANARRYRGIPAYRAKSTETPLP